MRLTLLSFYSGQIERGVEIYAQKLAQCLSRRHSVDLITAANLPIKPPVYRGDEKFFLRRLYLDPTSRHIYQATQSILSQLKNYPPDILYPLNNGWQSILGKLFCLRYKTKLVLGGHSGPGWDDRINLWLYPDLFIAFSQAQAQWAKKINRHAPISVISHGVDTDQFKPGTSSLNLNLQSPVFVTVSALSTPSRAGETAKNVNLTLEAVAQLKQGSLLVLGSGPDAVRIDQLGRQLLGPHRYSRFSVSHNVIHHYYQAADVFTLASSTSEAFGLSYLEALACNLPIVTVDDNLRREIIGSAGVFIKDPRDTQVYAKELHQAAVINWGDQPRHQAKKFSWDKIIDQYETAFGELLAA